MADLYLLVTDDDGGEVKVPGFAHVTIHGPDDLHGDTTAKAIIKKYQSSADHFRWCLKPVYMKYLMEHEKMDAVIYADNDIFFFAGYDFLFDDLREHPVLLSPHWRISDPEVDKDWFETNFKDGIYNAGFVGANRYGLDAVAWWAKACLYKCEKNFASGLYDDQKYLDFIPVLFEGTKVLRHRGCNVAYWNKYECKRVLKEGKVLINDEWPVVFIHFTASMRDDLKQGRDQLLIPYFNQYKVVLSRF